MCQSVREAKTTITTTVDPRGISVSIAACYVNATCHQELAQRINRLERDNTILGLCYGDTVDDRGGGGGGGG